MFLDGRFVPELSATDAAGVFRRLAALPAPAAPAAALTAAERSPDQRFARLNEAFATDGARIRIAAGAAPQRLELLFVASADAHSGGSYPRVEVQLAAGATLELLERHLSAGEAASFVNSAVSIELARGARPARTTACRSCPRAASSSTP